MNDPSEASFDVVVIGGGPAGENVAGRVAAAGLSVALIEKELVGGECSYWGCIPSKTLVRPGDLVAAVSRAPGVDTVPVDVAAVLAWRDEMTSNWTDDGQVEWLRGAGVTLLRGEGRLSGARRVVVEPRGESSQRELTARRAVVIATGTTAAVPPIDGLADARPWDNRGVTAAKKVPPRLLVLGGGAVGAEMAQAFARLGSRVTVLEGGERLLAHEEPFAGEEVRAAFEAEGIDVRVGARVVGVTRRGDGPGTVVVTLAAGETVEGDEILVAVGRRPATMSVGLDSVGLVRGHAVEVDGRFRATGVEGGWLYAVGDCNGRALLTHMGKYQARLAADDILGRLDDEPPPMVVPRVTFTDPQVAAVGLTEAEARSRGVEVRVVSTPTGGVAGSHVLGRGLSGTSHLVIDEARRTVVGATFTGPGVQELVHAATVAIVGEVGIDRLWHAVPSFPTMSEVWLRLLEAYGL